MTATRWSGGRCSDYLPDDINDERVWFDSAGDISGLREQVDQAAKAIGLAR